MYWYLEAPEKKLSTLCRTVGYCRESLVDWQSLIREVCTEVLSRQPKFKGTNRSWCQVGEALFRGKRKNHKGRLRKGDRKNPSEKTA